MHEAHSTHGRMRNVYNFYSESMKVICYVEEVCVDWRIILKLSTEAEYELMY
jgi:hypothetical protein